MVITVTNYGCVGESVLWCSVVVSDCNAKTGDVISATFYIPVMEINGYCDGEKLAMVNPSLYLFYLPLIKTCFVDYTITIYWKYHLG